jgi:hypothetical protein
MKPSDYALAIVALLLFIWPVKVMLLGEPWTWLPAANGIAGIFCLAVATANWRRSPD